MGELLKYQSSGVHRLKKIGIIDDDQENCMFFRLIFKNKFDLHFYPRYLNLESEPINADLLILNCNKLDSSITELYQDLRNGKFSKAIPILVLSGTDDNNSISASHVIEDLLWKPFTSEILLKTIEKYLAFNK